MPHAPRNAAASLPLPEAPLPGGFLEALPFPAAVATRGGEIVIGNAELSRLWGPDRAVDGTRHLGTLLGRENLEVLLAPDGQPAPRTVLEGVDGLRRSFAWSARPLGDDADRILVTAADVTREAALEDHVTSNQWFETGAALCGGLAHDFNNCLAAILGLSEIISFRLPPENPLHDFATRIAGRVERAKGLVRRFSQFSRKSTGAVDAQPTAMVLDELLPLLEAFMPANVPVRAEVCPETPWCTVDRQAFEHAVINCVAFLRAHLRKAGGSVTLSGRRSPAQDAAVVEITGSGPGLAAVDRERIFRLDLRPAASAYESRTGLYAARRLVQAGGCRMSSGSPDPHTLTFSLELPPAN